MRVTLHKVSATRGGNALEDEGLVGEQDDRRIVVDLPQCSREIVEAFEMATTDAMAQLIAETGDPKRLIAFDETSDIVFENRNVDAVQRFTNADRAVAAHARQWTMPPIVIAENRIDAERRLENPQRLGPLIGKHGSGDEIMPGVEIAQNDRDVGLQRIGELANIADAPDRHPRLASVNIGNDGDLERKSCRPARRRHRIGGEIEHQPRLDAARIGADAGCSEKAAAGTH